MFSSIHSHKICLPTARKEELRGVKEDSNVAKISYSKFLNSYSVTSADIFDFISTCKCGEKVRTVASMASKNFLR
jgi:hypothetical protein